LNDILCTVIYNKLPASTMVAGFELIGYVEGYNMNKTYIPIKLNFTIY
jgi:hypothetical protein